METLGNIYGNGSQTCRPKGKTYRDAQMGELVHFIAVEHAPEHRVICESGPTREKCGEGETATERQPPRALSWRAKCRSGFVTLPPAPLQEQPTVILSLEWA
jgi:hypothetical protein